MDDFVSSFFRRRRRWCAALAAVSFLGTPTAFAQAPAAAADAPAAPDPAADAPPEQAPIADAPVAQPPAAPAPVAQPPAAPAPLDTAAATKPAAPTKRKKKAKPSPKVEVAARLYTLWQVRNRADRPQNEFSIETARVTGIWRPMPKTRAVIEVELSGLAQDEASAAMLRDAYLRFAPLPVLRLQMGQFKKPFSRIQLYSRRRLPLVQRGLVNDDLVEDLGYGGRDVGVQVDGRIGRGIELWYAVGVFNGAGPNLAENDLDGSKDFAGRLESRLGKHLSLAANATLRTFDRRQDPLLPARAVGLGTDLEVQFSGFHALGELDMGTNAALEAAPRSIGGIALLWYRWRWTKTWAAEPLLGGEILIPDRGDAGRVYRVTAGANAVVGDFMRWMIDYQITEPVDVAPTAYRPEQRLFVQLAFDG
jgi:hypothetical protein